MEYLSQGCHQVTSVTRKLMEFLKPDYIYHDQRQYVIAIMLIFFQGYAFLFCPHFFLFGVVELMGSGCMAVELGFWGWGSLYEQRGITKRIKNYIFQYSGVYSINLWLMILQVEKISFTDDSAYVVMGIADTRLFFMMICDVKIKEQMDRAMVRYSISTFIWPCGILARVPRLIMK